MTNGASIKSLNTFSIDVLARRVATAHTESELLTIWQQASAMNLPILLLGGGSNVLFLENYAGVLLLNRIRGIIVNEQADAWHLHVGAGEVWHDLVIYCLDQRMAGLENLALIPGYVGAAPVQNIGAYGAELQMFCEYVDILHLENGKKHRLSAAECQFGDRDSIFKHHYRDNYAIVAVGLRLNKKWQPILSYGDLKDLDAQNVTPYIIFDTVCAVRRTKLPDPALVGNAGSFFKRPMISAQAAARLLEQYPDAPHYFQPNGDVKIAAGWLIERCQLKGYRIGDAAVDQNHALVLINNGKATGTQFVELAKYVRQQVANKFGIHLEPEVRFIGARGEVNAIELLKLRKKR